MNREDIIRLAIEAKLVCHWDGGCASAWVEGHDLTPYLERFAALVEAHALEEFADTVDELTNKSLHAQLNAVAAEREACANVCEILAWSQDSTWRAATMDCAAAIRARGQE
jgi:hypothetical protein